MFFNKITITAAMLFAQSLLGQKSIVGYSANTGIGFGSIFQIDENGNNFQSIAEFPGYFPCNRIQPHEVFAYDQGNIYGYTASNGGYMIYQINTKTKVHKELFAVNNFSQRNPILSDNHLYFYSFGESFSQFFLIKLNILSQKADTIWQKDSIQSFPVLELSKSKNLLTAYQKANSKTLVIEEISNNGSLIRQLPVNWNDYSDHYSRMKLIERENGAFNLILNHFNTPSKAYYIRPNLTFLSNTISASDNYFTFDYSYFLNDSTFNMYVFNNSKPKFITLQLNNLQYSLNNIKNPDTSFYKNWLSIKQINKDTAAVCWSNPIDSNVYTGLMTIATGEVYNKILVEKNNPNSTANVHLLFNGESETSIVMLNYSGKITRNYISTINWHTKQITEVYRPAYSPYGIPYGKMLQVGHSLFFNTRIYENHFKPQNRIVQYDLIHKKFETLLESETTNFYISASNTLNHTIYGWEIGDSSYLISFHVPSKKIKRLYAFAPFSTPLNEWPTINDSLCIIPIKESDPSLNLFNLHTGKITKSLFQLSSLGFPSYLTNANTVDSNYLYSVIYSNNNSSDSLLFVKINLKNKQYTIHNIGIKLKNNSGIWWDNDYQLLQTAKDTFVIKVYDYHLYPNKPILNYYYAKPVILEYRKSTDYFNSNILKIPNSNHIQIYNNYSKPQFISTHDFIQFQSKTLPELKTYPYGSDYSHLLFTCLPVVQNIDTTACFALNVHNQHITQNGELLEYYTAKKGCDSIAKWNIQITQINNAVNTNQLGMSATDSTVKQYQWIDCDSNQQIQGANNRFFTPTKSGKYAVMLYKNGCMNISECINWYPMMLKKISPQISVHPNPALDKIMLNLPENVIFEFSILDVQGKICKQGKSDHSTIEIASLKPGIYLLKMQRNNLTAECKFVKL